MGIEQYERSERALLQRIAQLEQLCRDMYRLLAFALDGKPGELAAQASLARSIHLISGNSSARSSSPSLRLSL